MIVDLAAMKCRPLGPEAALGEAEISRHLAALDGWMLHAGAIEKRYAFADFHRTMAFVNALAWIAHAQDHHPDVSYGYNHCTLRWSTHSARGITLNDFICAAKVDALLP